jgi:hypothetical protein
MFLLMSEGVALIPTISQMTQNVSRSRHVALLPTVSQMKLDVTRSLYVSWFYGYYLEKDNNLGSFKRKQPRKIDIKPGK